MLENFALENKNKKYTIKKITRIINRCIDFNQILYLNHFNTSFKYICNCTKKSLVNLKFNSDQLHHFKLPQNTVM